jgi:hypothetical protein
MDLHVHALQNVDRAEALPDILQLDDRALHGSSLAIATRFSGHAHQLVRMTTTSDSSAVHLLLD